MMTVTYWNVISIHSKQINSLPEVTHCINSVGGSNSKCQLLVEAKFVSKFF